MRPKFGSALLAGAMAVATIMAQYAAAQNTSAPGSSAQTQAPASGSLDIALTYNATRSDLVTSSQFWMQGGSVQIEGRFYGGWGAVADIAGMHIANINSSGVGLNMVTATFGPRYTWSPAHARWSIFAQSLVGEAFGMNSVFPNPLGATSTATSLALKAGGGLNFALSPRLALRALEANYLRSQLPNATDNVQNNLQLGAGLVLRFR
jgi:hypothetical protein